MSIVREMSGSGQLAAAAGTGWLVLEGGDGGWGGGAHCGGDGSETDSLTIENTVVHFAL